MMPNAKTEPNTFHFLNDIRSSDRKLCPACGKAKVTHKSDYPSMIEPFAQRTVHFCTGCGLGFVAKAKRMLGQYYTHNYAAENRGDRDINPKHYFRAETRANSKALSRYFTRAKRQTALLGKHGATFDTVLDFGSGPGYFLHVSKAANKHAFEPDTASSKYLDFLGAKQYDDIQDIATRGFDVITASHSIEHLPAEELQDTLQTLLAALKPTGRLLIEVPQGGHSYLHLNGSRQDPHTLFFTPQALVEAVQQAGANIIFQGAVAKPRIPARENPIYHPDPENPFFSAARGGLTVICKPSVKFELLSKMARLYTRLKITRS